MYRELLDMQYDLIGLKIFRKLLYSSLYVKENFKLTGITRKVTRRGVRLVLLKNRQTILQTQ